jgi:hypothetical protein
MEISYKVKLEAELKKSSNRQIDFKLFDLK